MNKQAKYKDGVLISRGIEWTGFFGPDSGFTVNPVSGCEHGCRWRMADGTIVDCYAETFDDRMHGEGHFKNILWHPEALEKVRARKPPAGIFIDSMSDLFGQRVNAEWIEAVLQTMRECPQHVFFTLTKNPRRLTEFAFPDNCLVGMSAPPTFMYGKEMNYGQQQAWFDKGLGWLCEADAKHRWLSLEPLTTDLSVCIEAYGKQLSWAVIGAGSNGSRKYQPDEDVFFRTLASLDPLPVFYKGNIDAALADKCGGWREEFPKLT